MKRVLSVTVIFLFILLWSSCRKDFEFAPSNGSLSFSKDTVYLDTVFSKISSSTYKLKVYNTSDEDIEIPTVKLGKEDDSKYRLSVDGIYGKTFNNVQILAKDSIFIFVETTVDINDTAATSSEYLYTDAIEFDSGNNLQKVELVTLVKDAVFIFPDRDDATKVVEKLTIYVNGEPVEGANTIEGRYLEDNELTFTKDKPYVIYGYAGVGNGKTLTIEAGARVHFHNNSGLFIGESGSINVNGQHSSDPEKLENEVIFESDRLEPGFAETPGQWGTIWLFPNSVNNTFNHATIKNASVAIYAQGNPDEPNHKVTLQNTQIYNSSLYGVFAYNSSVKAENLVINNCGQVSYAAILGGKHNLNHCTITNYWKGFSRQLPSLLINNYFVDNETQTAFVSDLIEANISNSIIYGNDNPEFVVNEQESDETVFNFKLTNCLVKFEDSKGEFKGPNFDFTNTSKYENVIFNEDPDFRDSAPDKNQLIIGQNSAANGKANTTFANQVPKDILNIDRTASPDIGAYQHITFK